MSISHTSTNLGCPLAALLTRFKRGSLALAGGKGTNLGELIGKGFQVPAGAVITTAAYNLSIQAKGLETVSTRPKKRLRKVMSTLVGFLASFVALITVLAFIFAEIQQPKFVNRDLLMQNALLIPPLLEPQVVSEEKVFVLSAEHGETVFLEGKSTNTTGYNGTYPGPTLRAHQGDHVRIVLTNNLSQAITTHWHGMHLPAIMDGGPHQEIAPGGVWEPHWTIENEAATLWYHPHVLEQTGEQVYSGLAGLFIIDDENSDSLNLPKEYGMDDLPLIVQDREFRENSEFVYEPQRRDEFGHTGMLGDTILVNGTYAPFVDVPAKQIRLRILNASNARRYNFGFEDGRTFQQIATDGGLLPSPVPRTRMILAPGERAEMIVDLAGETEPLTLISDAVHEENEVLRFVRTMINAERDENQVFKIIELRPQPTAEITEALPPVLNSIEWIPSTSAVRTRRFILDPRNRSINSEVMDHQYVNEVVHSGGVEIWEIINLSGTFHPFHIHGVQFQILDSGGKPPADYELGWKDTVLVSNAEIVHVIMRFPEFSDPHTPYMYHCHILEHEDMGMMGQFIVTDEKISGGKIYRGAADSGIENDHNHVP
jgi:FtsP/CotA-like multicopper oxidase with cupredoxin domain